MFSRLGTFFIVIFCSSSLFSHEFNPAHLVVNESEENIYEVKWMYPSKNIDPPIIVPIKTIMIGSIKVDMFSTAVSNSSS